MKQENKNRIIICGLSEAAEIVYIATLECGLEIIKVVDEKKSPLKWLDREVEPLESIQKYKPVSEIQLVD